MPSRNTIEIVINARDNASDVIKKLVGNTQKIGGLASAAIIGGTAAAGAAITAMATKGISEFMKFEQGMQEVFSLLPGISQDAMNKMTDQVENMSMRFGVLPEQTIPALYEALSAGIPQDNVFQFLEVANKAAIAGVTDLATATNGISSAMNAYGHDILSAGKASDIMFQTVKLGKTTFEELSNSLYNVSPTAAALGVSFEDLNAQIAAITAQGTPTSVATNQMRQMFVELSKAGGKTAETFQQLAGKTFKQFIAEGGNTQDALQLLEKHAKETGVGINDLFGSVEAGAAALSLTGKNTERFTGFLEQMNNAAGSTDLAFETMSKSLQFQVNRLNAKMAVLYKTIGEKLAPAFAPVIENAGNFVSFIIDIIDGVTDFTDIAEYDLHPALLSIAKMIVKVVNNTRMLISAFKSIMKAGDGFAHKLNAITSILDTLGFSREFIQQTIYIIDIFRYFGESLAILTKPILNFIKNNFKIQDVLVALGIAISTFVIPAIISIGVALVPIIGTFALLITGSALLRKAWEKNFLGIRDKVGKVIIWLSDRAYELQQVLSRGVGNMFEDADVSFITKIAEKFITLKEAVLPLFREIKTAISRIDFNQLFEIGTTLLSLTSPLGIIKTLFETIFDVNLFDIFIDGINKITEVLANLNAGMSLKEALGIEDGSFISQAIDTILTAFDSLKTFIEGSVIPALKDLGVWFLTDVLPKIVSFITSTVLPAIKEFLGFLQRLWNDVSPFLTSLADWFLTDVLPQVVRYIEDVLVPVIEDIIGWMQQIWTAVQPYLEDLYEWFVTTALPGIIDFLNNVVTPVIEGFITLLQDIWNVVSPVIQGLVDWFTTTGLPLVVDIINNVVLPAVQGLIDLLKGIWTEAQPHLENLKNGISRIFNWIKTNIIDPLAQRIEEFKQTLSNLGISVGGGFNAQQQAQSAAAKFSQMYGSNNISSSGGFGGYANGLPYVPKDMVVKVHQGERILTKEENQQGLGSNVYNTITLNFPNVATQEQADKNSKLYVNALRKQGVNI